MARVKVTHASGHLFSNLLETLFGQAPHGGHDHLVPGAEVVELCAARQAGSRGDRRTGRARIAEFGETVDRRVEQ
jgi:hypothetical protein